MDAKFPKQVRYAAIYILCSVHKKSLWVSTSSLCNNLFDFHASKLLFYQFTFFPKILQSHFAHKML